MMTDEMNKAPGGHALSVKRSAVDAFGGTPSASDFFTGPALTILVKTSFLDHTDLLLLGQTCKLWKTAVDNDSIWADLVHCRWASIVNHLPPSILATAREENHGYRALCKRLSLKVEDSGNYRAETNPAGLQASELVLLVEVTRNGKPVACDVIEDIQPLVDGEPLLVDLSLCKGVPASGDGIIFGRTLPANDDGLCQIENTSAYVGGLGPQYLANWGFKVRPLGWKVKLQLLRKPDGKMCSIFETDALDVYYAPNATNRMRNGVVHMDVDPLNIDVEGLKRELLEAALIFRSEYKNLDMKAEGLHLLKAIGSQRDKRVEGFYFNVESNLLFPKSPRYFGLDQTVRDLQNNNPRFGINWQNFAQFYEGYWEDARNKENILQYFQKADEEMQDMEVTFKGIEITAELSIHDGHGSFEGASAGSNESGTEANMVGFLHLVEQLKGWH